MTDPLPPLPVSASGEDALTVARRCVEEGARIALERFRGPLSVGVKGRGNLVTQVDIEIETALARLLKSEFPDHALLSEESNAARDDAGWTWVVDPLDGTRNYVSGIPFWCVNVALCRDGEPVVGVTYDPNRGDLFSAIEGQGTRLNGEPVRVSDRTSVQASVLGVDLGYDDARASHMLDLLRSLWPGLQAIRIPGSAALGLAYASCGRYDLFVHYYLFPWDLAAGILLVKEAGGTITDREGGPVSIRSEGIIAGGPLVHADFRRLAADRPWRDPPAA